MFPPTTVRIHALVPLTTVSSLVSFFIGKYSAGPEGKMVSEVAEDMANQVVHYYPTVTASKSDIQYVRTSTRFCANHSRSRRVSLPASARATTSSPPLSR